MTVNDEVYGRLTPDEVDLILDKYLWEYEGGISK